MAKKNIWCKLFKSTPSSNAFTVIQYNMKKKHNIEVDRFTIIGMWTTLLCEGINKEGKLFPLEELAISLSHIGTISINTASLLLLEFIHYYDPLLAIDEENNMYVVNWLKYNAPKKTDNTNNERQKRFREKPYDSNDSNAICNAEYNGVIECNALPPLQESVTNPCNALQNVTVLHSRVTNLSMTREAIAMRASRARKREEKAKKNNAVNNAKHNALDKEKDNYSNSSSSSRKGKKNFDSNALQPLPITDDFDFEEEFKTFLKAFPESHSKHISKTETRDEFIKVRAKTSLENLLSAIKAWDESTPMKYKTTPVRWLREGIWENWQNSVSIQKYDYEKLKRFQRQNISLTSDQKQFIEKMEANMIQSEMQLEDEENL